MTYKERCAQVFNRVVTWIFIRPKICFIKNNRQFSITIQYDSI